MDDSKILLENGTNELMILEFKLGDNYYGINVAKIREITKYEPVTPIPNAHPSIEGVFMPRDVMITAIDLKNCLGRGESDSKGLFIITNFNKMHIAFRVHSVVGISRISWEAIQKPDKALTNGEDGVATGIAQCGDNLVTILDFEKIVAEIAPETTIQVSDIDKLGDRMQRDQSIILAEDSILLTKMISDSLLRAGYTNLTTFNNGREAWEFLESIRSEPDFYMRAALLITDIEMPEMDGHRLTKLVKEDENMKNMPVIIFSSLINEEMRVKGKQLGADEQLSKPEIGRLVEVMDALLDRRDIK